jgi:hypothetical protein
LKGSLYGKVLTGLHCGAAITLLNPQVPVIVRVALVPSGMFVIMMFPDAVVEGLLPQIVPTLVDKL